MKLNKNSWVKSAAIAGAVLTVADVAERSSAAVITQWTFNSVPSDANTTTGTTTASTGMGTVTLVGGTTSTYASGSTTDTTSPTDNSGLNVTTFPAQSTGGGTAGVEYATSTVGAFPAGAGEQLQIALDFRQSGTASRFFELQLSADGVNFSNASGGVASIVGPINSSNTLTTFSNSGLYTNDSGGGSQNYVSGITYTLPAGSAYENDPAFAFQFVAVFDPTNGTSYTSSNAGTSAAYTAAGTARFDDVTVSAAVPEPATLSVAGLAVAGLLARRRRATR
jgi:hypothetical protein